MALQKERDWFAEKGKSTWDHDYSIHYLRTGEIHGDLEKCEILDAAINDFDCLYHDYCN